MKTYDLVGIGNAVVDVITQCDESFLDHMGIEKGIMQLVERERGETLYGAMSARVQTPGGSVANTIAGAGALGLQTAFIGRVRDDALGKFYASAMSDHGIDFVNPPVTSGEMPTSRSMIFVTPDGERSMNTYLGISTGLGSGRQQQQQQQQAVPLGAGHRRRGVSCPPEARAALPSLERRRGTWLRDGDGPPGQKLGEPRTGWPRIAAGRHGATPISRRGGPMPRRAKEDGRGARAPSQQRPLGLEETRGAPACVSHSCPHSVMNFGQPQLCRSGEVRMSPSLNCGNPDPPLTF